MIASTAVWAIWAPNVGPTDELVNSDWSTPKRSSSVSCTRVTCSGCSVAGRDLHDVRAELGVLAPICTSASP